MLPYTLILCFILILSWTMMVNIAKILREKMILQNKVDNAALSIANLQARTLNFIGFTDSLKATVLSSAGYPDSFIYEKAAAAVPSEVRDAVLGFIGYLVMYVPTFSTQKVCGSLIPGPFCDYKCNRFGAEYKGVKNLRSVINSIQKVQDSVLALYGVNYLAILKNFSTDNTVVTVAPSRTVKDIKNINLGSFIKNLSPQQQLGIKKNTKGIQYFKTVNHCVNIKAAHWHSVTAEPYAKDKYSWYVQDENFYDKKLVAVGMKFLNSDKSFPLFKNIFDITAPPLIYVSAAGLYNTKGAMFPEKETDITGVNFASLSALIIIAKQTQMLMTLIEEFGSIPVIGWAIATMCSVIEAAMVATSTLNFYNAQKDKDSPLYNYSKAKKGGWDAHLVPL